MRSEHEGIGVAIKREGVVIMKKRVSDNKEEQKEEPAPAAAGSTGT
jgi:hypothetical protein